LEIFGAKGDRKPRLKPGFTFTRLFVSFVVVVVLAIVAKHFVEGSYPSSDCGAKEIDTGAHKEGTCTEGDTTIVVVNEDSVLKLQSLEARLLGTQERKTIGGPAGSKTAKGKFLTFELEVTNRTDAPATVAEGQFVLYLGGIHTESVEVEENYEPRSFLARSRVIPPGGSETGTVTFAASVKGAESLTESGNLDVVNLGTSVSKYEPEGLFSESEYGAIRTYR
jgi:hypothetical protein